MSAAVGSEDDNDWVKKFWSLKVGMGIFSSIQQQKAGFSVGKHRVF
jgi:hypothetical protein